MKKVTFIILSILLGLAVVLGHRGLISRAAPKPEQGVAGWQLFRDDTYGFQIRYPGNWRLEEAKMPESEGDLALKRVLLFRPQNWQSSVAPVTVEVGVGNLDELQRMWSFLAADQSNSVKINGYEVFYGIGMYDVVSRVFVHPTNKDLLIAVRDNVGGAGQDSKYLSEILQRMLSTFRFDK